MLDDVEMLEVERVDVNSTGLVSRSNAEGLTNSGPAESPKPWGQFGRQPVGSLVLILLAGLGESTSLSSFSSENNLRFVVRPSLVLWISLRWPHSSPSEWSTTGHSECGQLRLVGSGWARM